MSRPKRVLCIMDLSLAGRAALGVALPVYAACGVQACALPAALFSTHTGGFGPVEKQDEADFCARALAHFAREDITFDAVHIGYLFGPAQFALANAALRQYPNALHLVDPALGDDGRLYGGMDTAAIEGMRQLCAKAQLITPNYTESALLCGLEPDVQPPAESALLQRLETLAGTPRPQNRGVLITSVPTGAAGPHSASTQAASAQDGGFETVGRTAGGETFHIPSRRVPQRYPGTGDTLSAAVGGLLLQGLPLPRAAAIATDFVEAAARATFEGGGDARHGLWLEPLLSRLAPTGHPVSGE